METESATPTGAETSARPDASAATSESSVHDRLKAFFTPEPETKEPEKPTQPLAKPDAKAQEEEEPEVTETEDGKESAEEEPLSLSTISELAEATGLDLDRIMDLDIPTKIDGKDGKARLRDMIKSFQLEGHLNQKLMAHADEKKAFETERLTFHQQAQQKLQQVDAAVQIATRLLEGEFANVNWQELQANDRLEFNQKVTEYQQRQQALKYLADQIGQERQKADSEAATKQQAYLAEQKALLDTKLPEWADNAKRSKDIAEMATVLKDAYGVSENELRSVVDHRQILIARDAWKWQQLQKQKPAIVNKVKAAPKLIKPGATQSRAAQEGLQLQQDRNRLGRTGKVQDAKPILKKLLFN